MLSLLLGWGIERGFDKMAFPRLYGIVIDREASVEASLSRQGVKDRRICYGQAYRTYVAHAIVFLWQKHVQVS